MARGARQRAQADYALAISGIAGPDGGTPDKPVGTIVMAVCDAQGERAVTFHWKGTRDELRARSVSVALDLLRRRLAPG
jgi:nicotinamide-nucleotide amidase